MLSVCLYHQKTVYKLKPWATVQNVASKNFYGLLKTVYEIATIAVGYLVFKQWINCLQQAYLYRIGFWLMTGKHSTSACNSNTQTYTS